MKCSRLFNNIYVYLLNGWERYLYGVGVTTGLSLFAENVNKKKKNHNLHINQKLLLVIVVFQRGELPCYRQNRILLTEDVSCRSCRCSMIAFHVYVQILAFASPFDGVRTEIPVSVQRVDRVSDFLS